MDRFEKFLILSVAGTVANIFKSQDTDLSSIGYSSSSSSNNSSGYGSGSGSVSGYRSGSGSGIGSSEYSSSLSSTSGYSSTGYGSLSEGSSEISSSDLNSAPPRGKPKKLPKLRKSSFDPLNPKTPAQLKMVEDLIASKKAVIRDGKLKVDKNDPDVQRLLLQQAAMISTRDELGYTDDAAPPAPVLPPLGGAAVIPGIQMAYPASGVNLVGPPSNLRLR